MGVCTAPTHHFPAFVMKNAVHFYWTINKVLRPALKFCGADFLADNFKFNFATYVYFIGAICAIGSAAYTLTQPDRDKMLKFMSMLGILLQVSAPALRCAKF